MSLPVLLADRSLGEIRPPFSSDICPQSERHCESSSQGVRPHPTIELDSSFKIQSGFILLQKNLFILKGKLPRFIIFKYKLLVYIP